MIKLKIMIWLALILPWPWWRKMIWKAWFSKRVISFSLPIKVNKMSSVDNLIKVYVPEAEMMSFEDAARLAVERDEQAAADLKNSAETQLKIEKAASAANLMLDKEFSLREKRIMAELGYLAD